MNDTQIIFSQFDWHLMEDERPSDYFIGLLNQGLFLKEFPFDMLLALAGIKQSPVHHPEGDVWAHTMLVVDNAAREKKRSKDPRVLMWAALLHDIGKPATTRVRRGRITAYGHDKEGGTLAARFLSACGQDQDFSANVSALVRWHMQPLFAAKNLPFFDPEAMAAQANIREVALLGFCDRLGRGLMSEDAIDKERRNIADFEKKCVTAR